MAGLTAAKKRKMIVNQEVILYLLFRTFIVHDFSRIKKVYRILKKKVSFFFF